MKKLCTFLLAIVATSALWAQNNVITYTASSKLEIQDNAFNVAITDHSYADGTGTITFAGEVTHIGKSAFSHCSSLTSIHIPASVTYIGDFAFAFCPDISFTVDANNPVYSLIDNVSLIDKNTNTLVCGTQSTTQSIYINHYGRGALAGSTKFTSLYISSSGQKITFDYAAFWNSGLTSMEIPWNVVAIDTAVFAECPNLESIKWYSDISLVPVKFCYKCPKLKSVQLPDAITKIGDEAFYLCSSLSNINFPNGIQEIGGYSFAYTDFDTISFPSSLKRIGASAFGHCTNLRSIVLQDSVEFLDYWAFGGCSSLSEITCHAQTPPLCGNNCFYDVDKSIPVYVPVGSVDAYKAADGWKEFTNIKAIGSSDCPKYSVCGQCGDSAYWSLDTLACTIVISGKGAIYNYTYDDVPWREYERYIRSVSIQDGITKIGNEAFCSFDSIYSVSLPNSVREIGDSAFYVSHFSSISIPSSVLRIRNVAFAYCYRLSSITSYASTPPLCDEHTFCAVDKTIPVYVPVGSIAAYQGADVWKEFTNIVPIGENLENGYEYVDLGLSVKWATYNVGATKPEEYGDYFAWGETSPKTDYSWSTYKYCNGSDTTLTKYCIHSRCGIVDGKTTLEKEDDAASVNWGGNWRMPTHVEQQELVRNCTATWTDNYQGTGIAGRIFTSKKTGYTDKFIFLPAAGIRYDTDLDGTNLGSAYWSSTLEEYNISSSAWGLNFISAYVEPDYNYSRYYGYSVRAVCPSSTISDTIPMPEGALPGLFSINDSTKVYFSQGALQYNAALGEHQCADGTTKPGTWRFAPNQYEVSSGDNSMASATYDGWISKFTWGSSGYLGRQPYEEGGLVNGTAFGGPASITDSYFDWGIYNAISNGGNTPGEWRTMSGDEWRYLASGRPNAVNRQAFIRYSTPSGIQSGLLLLPDAWDSISTGFSITNRKANIDTLSMEQVILLTNYGALIYEREHHLLSTIGEDSISGDLLYASIIHIDNYNAVSQIPAYGRFVGVRLISNYNKSKTIAKHVVGNGSPSNMGYVSGGVGMYNVGDTAILTAKPMKGYRFYKWSNGSSENPCSIVVSQDTVMTAYFRVAYDNMNAELLPGALNGVFSVSDSTKVRFAQGSLQFQASTKSWRLAENQYDATRHEGCDPNGPYNCYFNHLLLMDSTTSTWVDMFYAGSSGYNGTYNHNHNNISKLYNTYYDWGLYNAISYGGEKSGLWYTLSPAEFSYLLRERPNADKLCAITHVNNVIGHIFLPDNWEDVAIADLKQTRDKYTIEEWLVMESLGAVFMPWNYSGTMGQYWTLANAFDTYYNSGLSLFTSYDSHRINGITVGHASGGLNFGGVRLVQPAEAYYVTIQSNVDSCYGISRLYPANQVNSIQLHCADGYLFKGWSDGNMDNPRLINLTSDTTLTASFERGVQISVEYDPYQGTASEDTVVAIGDKYTLQAQGYYPYEFSYWSSSDGDYITSSSFTDTAEHDITYYAYFTQAWFDITVTSDNTDWGSVTGSQTGVYKESYITIEAIPNSGYHFIGWSDGNTDNPRTIYVTEDATFTAFYSKNCQEYSYIDSAQVCRDDLPYEWHRMLLYQSGIYADSMKIQTGCDSVYYLYLDVQDCFNPDHPLNPGNYQVTLEANPMEGGTMVGAGKYKQDSTITICAHPNAGYRFIEWSDGVTDTIRTITIGAHDTTFVAYFEHLCMETITVTDYQRASELYICEETEIIVTDTGYLDIDKKVTAKNLTIYTNSQSAGQINSIENLSIGDISMVLQLDPSKVQATKAQWYAFAVPFDVNLQTDIRKSGESTPATYGSDFLVEYYDGALRASTQQGWVRCQSTDQLKPGRFYMMSVNGTQNTWVFSKKVNGTLVELNTIQAEANYATSALHRGWNGLANTLWQDAKTRFGGEYYDTLLFATIYNNEQRVYEVVPSWEYIFATAKPFFIQVQESMSVLFERNNPSQNIVARKSSTEANPYYEFSFTSSSESGYVAKSYLSASASKANEYVIGKDVEKMMGGGSLVPQIWMVAFDTSLSAYEAPLNGDSAYVPLGLYVPVAGEYRLSHTDNAELYDLELYHNSQKVVPVERDSWTLVLEQGTNTSYSLMVTPHKKPAGTDQLTDSADGRFSKIVMDGQLYIIREGKMFNAQGGEVR